MSISKKLLNHLGRARAKYDVVDHKTVYTAYDLASTLKKKLEEVAKSVVIESDRQHLIVVLPGNRRVDLKKLKKLLKSKRVAIAKEQVHQKILHIKAGAVTPFGKLYKNLPVFIDKALMKTKKLLVTTGSFEQSLHMSAKELLRTTEATLADLSEKTRALKKKR